jgi:hypothetical protein
MKKVIAVLLVAFLLAGCAEFNESIKPLLPKPIADAFTEFAELYTGLTNEQKATLEGGATLGAIGAVAGQLIGKDTESTVAGAAAGLVIGSLAANWYAKRTQARIDDLEKQGDDLDARIEYARGVNSDAEEYIDNLKKQLEETKSKVEELRNKHERNEITEKELETERVKIANQVKLAQDNKLLLKAQLDELKKYRKTKLEDNDIRTKQLDEEIAKLETDLKVVEEHTIKLASTNV